MGSELWNEIRESLRIVARNAVADYRTYGYDYVKSEDAEDFDNDTDLILALIAEAMLSEEAVEAGATAVAKDPYKWGYNIILDAYRWVIREGIQAALTAAGVTSAGREGGEGDGDV